MANDDKRVPLRAPVKNPHNIEATKYYIFNETGNVMIASTVDNNQQISQEVQDVFNEVSVFFAAMSRSITTTINKATGKPYSLYNYEALERIISGSGLFVHVTEEDVKYDTNQFGASFSKELIESLLGLATGAGSLSFASAMVASIGNEGLNLGGAHRSANSKVGNIVFVCEYLMGMPLISAIVVYADAKENLNYIKAGPCFSERSISTSWKMHKDTYMFVTPKFIRNYAGDLDTIESDPNYVDLIDWFQGLLLQTPTVELVADGDNNVIKSGSSLEENESYKIEGRFLGDSGTLKFANGKGQIKLANWSSHVITFSVSGTQDVDSVIDLVDSKGHTIAQTPGAYTIAASGGATGG